MALAGSLRGGAYTRGGGGKTLEFVYKTLCFILTYLNFQSPPKCSPLDAIHLSRCFFSLLKTVYELIDVDAF